MPGSDNYDFTTNWNGKKPVQPPKNYVEITPEQQAEIDKANAAAAEAARNSEALQQGLSNKKPDLGKGISIQNSKVENIEDVGNGKVKITYKDGSVIYTLEPSGEYAQISPSKVRWSDKVDERVRELSGGHITEFTRGAGFMATVGTLFAGGYGLLVKAAKAVQAAVTGAKATTALSAGVLTATACTELSPPDEKPDSEATLEWSSKEQAQMVIGMLNNPENVKFLNNENYSWDSDTMTFTDKKTGNSYDLSTKTLDNVDFEYGFDVKEGDRVSPFIKLGTDTDPSPDVDNRLKLYINTEPLVDLTGKNVVDYIKIFYNGDIKSKDGIVAAFEANGDNAQVAFGDKLELPLDQKKDLTAPDIISYINLIGDDLKTSDNIAYDFRSDNNSNAQVRFEFGKGLVHNIGDDVSLAPESPTAKLSAMLAEVGFKDKITEVAEDGKSVKIAMNFQTSEDIYGSAATPLWKGIKVDFAASPDTDLKSLTSGSPKVTITLGDKQFTGELQNVKEGEFDLQVYGNTKKNDAGGLYLKNENGTEIYIQREENFDLGFNYSGYEHYAPYDESYVIYVRDGDTFKERYIMANPEDGTTSIGLIDRTEMGTQEQFVTSQPSQNIFDTKGAIEADNYYIEKETNLNTAYDQAITYYKNKEINLDTAYKNANENYKYFNKVDLKTIANVEIP